MNRPLRIAIVGYGVAGISASIFLRRLGHEVAHYERASVGEPVGSGLLLHSVGLEVLNRLGLRSAALARGAVITRIQGSTRSGRRVIDLRYEDFAIGNHGLGIQRAALLELLRDADPQAAMLQGSRHVIAVNADEGYLFERNQGRLGPFDLIVAADGANSVIRSGLKALVRHDRPYAWGALVCLLDDSNDIGGDKVLQSFAGTRHVAIWPVGSRSSAAPRQVNVSVNVPISRCQELGSVEKWQRYLAEVCPCVAGLLDRPLSRKHLLLYTYRDVALHRYYFGRVAFLGDAAHSMSPQLGQGASMALLDSFVLANALQRNHDMTAALAEFDRERRSHVTEYQRISRWVTPMFQSESRILASLRDRAFYPLSRVSSIKRLMLKVISGQRLGLFAARGIGYDGTANAKHRSPERRAQ